jgi:hypothetical protein
MKKVFLMFVVLIGFGISVNAQNKFNTKQTVCWSDGIGQSRKIEFNTDGSYVHTYVYNGNTTFKYGNYKISECAYIILTERGTNYEQTFTAELINCNSLKSLIDNTWKEYTKEKC